MTVRDTQGHCDIGHAASLLDRLTTVRVGRYGAFILAHDGDGPTLWILINGDLAYVHYFATQPARHAGCQASGMTPAGCDDAVHFVQVGGDEADAFDMVPAAVVSVDAAYRAGAEFLVDPKPPRCIDWLEL